MADQPVHDIESLGEVNLGELIFMLWRAKWYIALVVFACLAWGISYAVTAVPVFKASMVVRETMDASKLGAASVLQNIGLGDGLSLQSSGDIDPLFLVYKRRAVAERLDIRHQAILTTFGGAWDPQLRKWIPPSGFTFRMKQTIKGWLGMRLWSAPNLDDLQDYIANKVKVDQVVGTKMYTFSFEHANREFSTTFLRWVFEASDAILRVRALKRANVQLEYLRKRIDEAELVDERRVLLNLLMRQVTQKMLLDTGLPYAVEIVEPVSVPTNPLGPSPTRVGVIALLMGLALGAMLVFLANFVRIVVRGGSQAKPIGRP